jgi:PAS domain S-box-containing protein
MATCQHHDLEGRFTFVNRAFLTTYGYGESEVMGRTVALIDSPRNPPGLQVEIREATRRGTWRGELWNRRKDGRGFPVALTTSQIRDPDGRWWGSWGMERHHQAAARRGDQQAVYRIAEAAGTAGGLETLLRAVHRIVGELMRAENFFVALYDRAAGLLTFPYFVDQVDTADAPRPLHRGLTEYVLRTGRALLGTPESLAALEHRGEVELVGAPSVDWLGVPLNWGRRRDRRARGAGLHRESASAPKSSRSRVRVGQVAMAIGGPARRSSCRRVRPSTGSLSEGRGDVPSRRRDAPVPLAVSEAAVRRYSYSREEILRHDVLDIRPREVAKLMATPGARGSTARATVTHIGTATGRWSTWR